ncbi:MAG: TetR/AcrR family transcriptional regulator [Spirochaetaceae bacterium]|nr:TetR/AcrR family transcriptional regulator [Spirochaetaceae bacterium]
MAAVNPDADSRELILAAAEALVARRGIDAASLADIAAAAGVSRGTLYYHYPSKDELVLDIAERHMAALTARIVALAKESGPEGIPGMLETLVTELLADETRSATHMHLLHCAFEGKEAVRDRMAASYRGWFGLVAAELSRAGLAPEATEEAGRLVVAVLDGLVIQKRVLGPRAGIDGRSVAALLAAALGRPTEGA